MTSSKSSRRPRRRTIRMWRGWAIVKANGNLFDQNGYPFLTPNRRAASMWCDDGEYPARVTMIWTPPKRKATKEKKA